MTQTSRSRTRHVPNHKRTHPRTWGSFLPSTQTSTVTTAAVTVPLAAAVACPAAAAAATPPPLPSRRSDLRGRGRDNSLPPSFRPSVPPSLRPSHPSSLPDSSLSLPLSFSLPLSRALYSCSRLHSHVACRVYSPARRRLCVHSCRLYSDASTACCTVYSYACCCTVDMLWTLQRGVL